MLIVGTSLLAAICQHNVTTGMRRNKQKNDLTRQLATSDCFLLLLKTRGPTAALRPSTHRPTSRRYARLWSIPAAAASRGSRSCGLAQRLVVLRAAVPVVKVAASGYVGRRRDPVVLLQLRSTCGASHRVAGSVQRVVPATVAEPVEAVRPPGGHLRVGGRTGERKEKSETRIGSTAK